MKYMGKQYMIYHFMGYKLIPKKCTKIIYYITFQRLCRYMYTFKISNNEMKMDCDFLDTYFNLFFMSFNVFLDVYKNITYMYCIKVKTLITCIFSEAIILQI